MTLVLERERAIRAAQLRVLGAVSPQNLRERLAARMVPTPAGCHLWTGAAERNGCGYLRVAAAGVEVCLPAAALALYLADGVWPAVGERAAPTCATARCCRPEHLRLAPFAYPKVVSVEAVQHMKALYFGPRGMPAFLRRFPDRRTALRRAAFTFGVGTRGAQRLLAGRGAAEDVAAFARVHAEAEAYARERAAARAEAWTMDGLARLYGLSKATVSVCLHGLHRTALGHSPMFHVKHTDGQLSVVADDRLDARCQQVG